MIVLCGDGDEERLVAVAAHELAELCLGNARENGRARDLVAVEMQDRQHRAVGTGIQELVGVPTRRERAGLGLAVADDAGNEQVGVVVRRTVRMHECVAELTAFVDRAGCFRRDVARDPTGKRELAEELAQTFLVLTDVGVHLAVGSFEIRVGNEARTAVSGPRDVEHAQAALADRAIEMDVDEIEAGGRSEVAEQTRLHVFRLERFAQQGIVQQVDLPD